tara:strand:- start:279 stop:395 length:117 start_codon:yes stop_codon:yes gene_type:complete
MNELILFLEIEVMESIYKKYQEGRPRVCLLKADPWNFI